MHSEHPKLLVRQLNTVTGNKVTVTYIIEQRTTRLEPTITLYHLQLLIIMPL